MYGSLPASHVTDALKLEEADGRVSLFELSPLSGGVIRFKSDNDVTWLGNLYEGIPLQLTGEEIDMDRTPEPQLSIGQPDLDLLPFKGLIFDGHLEGGTLVRHTLLLDDLLSNANVKRTSYYRIKRVAEYSRTRVSIVLSGYSSATLQTLPFRQYIPPAFPYVTI